MYPVQMFPFGGLMPIRGRPRNPIIPAAVPVPPRHQQPPARNRNVRLVEASTTDFLITIHDYANTLTELTEVIENMAHQYVIGKEETTTRAAAAHYHIYLKTNAEFRTIAELRNLLQERLFPEMQGASINIKSCDTVQAIAKAIKYCTKSDRFAIVKNISESKCHLFFRTHSWVRRNPTFDVMSPFFFEFTVTLKNSKELLSSIHTSYWDSVALDKKLQRHIQQCAEFDECYTVNPNTWLSTLRTWSTIANQLRTDIPETDPKNRCVLLHGAAGTGKTRALEMFAPQLCTYAYYPGPVGQFMFSGLQSSHKSIYFSDTQPELWENHEIREMFLRLSEGDMISVEVKHKNPRLIECTCPILMVTNFLPPPQTREFQPFHRRFTVIHANEQWDNCVTAKAQLGSVESPHSDHISDRESHVSQSQYSPFPPYASDQDIPLSQVGQAYPHTSLEAQNSQSLLTQLSEVRSPLAHDSGTVVELSDTAESNKTADDENNPVGSIIAETPANRPLKRRHPSGDSEILIEEYDSPVLRVRQKNRPLTLSPDSQDVNVDDVSNDVWNIPFSQMPSK